MDSHRWFRGTVYLVVAQLTISESFQQKNRRKVQRIDFYFGSLPITDDIQPTADQVVVLVRFLNVAMRGLLFQADSDDYLLLQMEPKLTSERPKAKPDFRRIHLGAFRPDVAFTPTQCA